MKTNQKFRRHVTRGNYRAYVGPKDLYDMKGAWQFMVMCLLGLREHHKFLEIGCGSLRAGRLFIPYLKPGNYFGLEPQEEVVKRGLESELGHAVLEVKRPQFTYNDQFDLSEFGGQKFDYILSHSVIMHLSTPAMRQSIRSAAEVLLPTGVLVASYVAGNVTGKKQATYPEAVWHAPASVKAAVTSAGLVYRLLRLTERHPAVRWFVATRPGHKAASGSVMGLLNQYWQRWEKRGR
jgi:SAM-dependent methyltransferase